MTDRGPDEPSGAMTPQELAAARRKLRRGFDAAPEPDEQAEPAPRSPEPEAEPEPEPEPEPARPARRPLRVANCSGFYGDRISAAREMVEGGPDRRPHR